jgi:hypothetical protein
MNLEKQRTSQDLLQQKNNEKMQVNGAGQKVVAVSEVKKWLSKGYEFVTKLDDREAIVRLSK